MYRHKKCRYVCGFVPLLDLNTAKESIYFDMAKKKMEKLVERSFLLNLELNLP